MRFKIDKNLKVLAAAMVAPKEPENVAVELCARFIDAGMIEDTNENWGKSVLRATGPQYISDVCAVLAGFLYGDNSRPVPSDIFNAFCALTIMGDGNCPFCGGTLVYDDTEGHTVHDGDYYTPDTYVIDNYIYHCAECGKTIKSKEEL